MLTLINWIGARYGVRMAWAVVVIVIPVLALVIGAIGGALVARHYTKAPLQAVIAKLHQDKAEAKAKALEDQATRTKAAKDLSDNLAGKLATALLTNAQLTQEKTDALTSATAGRACLSDRALRVLNGSPGIRVSGVDGMPKTGTGADATSGATGPDPDRASAISTELTVTDTGMATWAARAGQQHETCRLRLDALIDFHEKQPTPAGARVEQ